MLLKLSTKHKRLIACLIFACTVFTVCSQPLTVFAVDGIDLQEQITENDVVSDYECADVNDATGNTSVSTDEKVTLRSDDPSIAVDSKILNYIDADRFDESGHTERLYDEEELNTYVFLNANGTKSVYYMDENVKFVDKNGDVREKDISLVSKTDGFGIVRNEFELHIPNDVASGISMSYEGYDVKLIPQTSVKAVTAKQVGESVVYNGVFGTNTVLQYTPMLSGIKEDVVMIKYIPNATFSFILETDGLGLYCNENGYYLAESSSSKAILHLGKVIVYDAVGKPEYGNMTVETVADKQKYILSLTAPEEFLTDSATVYPVTIDPNITISDNASGEGAIEDAVLFSGRPSRNYGDYKYLSVGYVDSTYGTGRVAVKLPGLYNSADYGAITASDISSVKFYCWDTSGNSARTVNLYRITSGAWDENEVTYGDSVTYSTATTWGKSMSSGAWTDFDITTLVRSWKNGTYSADKGFILVNPNETNASYKKAPYSSEATTTTYRPYVVFSYTPSDSHDITGGNVTIEIEEGETCYLTATNPYGVSFNWTSSDPLIATISSTGMLTALKAGKTTITASFVHSGGTYNINCTVYVYLDVGAFYIKNVYSEYVLKAQNGYINNNTKVNQYTIYEPDEEDEENYIAKYETRQLWRINHLRNNVYSIRPLYKLDMALHITGTSAGIYNVGHIDTLDRVSSYAQWEISWVDNGYTLKNVGSNKMLQIANGSTTFGVNATVATYSGNAWQKWELDRASNPPEGVVAHSTQSSSSYYNCEIPSKAIVIGETKTLDDLNLIVMSYQTVSPLNLVSWSPDDDIIADVDSNGTVTANSCGMTRITASYSGKEISFDLYVIPFVNGTYFFKNKDTEKYMQPDDNGGSHMENHTLDGTDEQKWIFESLDNGYYKIVSSESGLALSVPSGYETSSGINIIQETYLGYDRQQWEFVETSEDAYKIRARSSPGHLVLSASDTYSGTLIKQNVYVSDNDYIDEWQPIRMLPLSGNELDYTPTLWSDSTIQYYTNCYNYAINNQVDDDGDLWLGAQNPGEYSETIFSLEDIESIINAVAEDYEKYNSNYDVDYLFIPIDRYQVCPEGTYKIAIVHGYITELEKYDYHFYRQNSNGLWSHKQGRYPVTNLDKSSNLIIDPALADRGEYTTFVGFFAITPWNRYHGVAT